MQNEVKSFLLHIFIYHEFKATNILSNILNTRDCSPYFSSNTISQLNLRNKNSKKLT